MGLIEMMKKRIEQMEEKKNDTAANKKKQEAWSSVAKEMTASFLE